MKKSEEYIDLDNKPTFSKNIIILLLSIVLCGAIGYIFYQERQHKLSTYGEISTIDDLERSRENLKQELRLARADYDTAKTVIVTKDADLLEKDRVIFEKQKKIQNILNQEDLTKSDLYEAKRLIISLRSELNEYKEQIETLRAHNKKLQNDNSQLAEKNKIANEKNDLISKDLETVKLEKETLNQNVNSTLSISNYSLTGLRVKNSGKEIETERAKRINKMRVSFNVDPNLNTLSDTKELFIAIYKPDGTLGKFEDANPGKLPLRSGKSVEYSDRVTFNFDPVKGNKISFDWKDYDFPKGEYIIDIYNNGFKIGQNTISLK